MKDIEEIKKSLKPFDVICFYKPDIWPLRKNWFKRILYWILSKPIVWEAHNFFGSKGDSKIFHVELYLGDSHNLVIEAPKVHWGDIDEVKYENFSIYRMNNYEFSETDREFAIDYLSKESTYYRDNGDEYKMELIGSLYNFGDLGNILLNDIAGSVVEQKYKPFSVSSKDTVCSIGIASFFEAFRQSQVKKGNPAYGKLFNKISIEKFRESNPKYLDKIEEDYTEFDSVSQGAVRPAFFGNSDFFRNEFSFVKAFKK